MRRGEVAEIKCDANLVYPNHKRPPQLKAKEPVIVDVGTAYYRYNIRLRISSLTECGMTGAALPLGSGKKRHLQWASEETSPMQRRFIRYAFRRQ